MKLVLLIVAIYSATGWSLPVEDTSNNAEATSIFDIYELHRATQKESVEAAKAQSEHQQVGAEGQSRSYSSQSGHERFALQSSRGSEPTFGDRAGAALCTNPCNRCANPCSNSNRPTETIPGYITIFGGTHTTMNKSERYEYNETHHYYQPMVVYPVVGSSSQLITIEEYLRQIAAQHPTTQPNTAIWGDFSSQLTMEQYIEQVFNRQPISPLIRIPCSATSNHVYPSMHAPIAPSPCLFNWDGSSYQLITMEEYIKRIFARQQVRPPTQPTTPCTQPPKNVIPTSPPAPSVPSPCFSNSIPCGGSVPHAPGGGSTSPSRPCQLSDPSHGGSGVNSGSTGQLGVHTSLFGLQTSTFWRQYMSRLEQSAQLQYNQGINTFGTGGVDFGFFGRLGSRTNWFGNNLNQFMDESARLARLQAQNVQGNALLGSLSGSGGHSSHSFEKTSKLASDTQYDANGHLQSQSSLSTAEGENHNINGETSSHMAATTTLENNGKINTISIHT